MRLRWREGPPICLDSSENTGGVDACDASSANMQRNGSQRTGSRLVQISTDERQRGRLSTLKGSVLSCPCLLSEMEVAGAALGGKIAYSSPSSLPNEC